MTIIKIKENMRPLEYKLNFKLKKNHSILKKLKTKLNINKKTIKTKNKVIKKIEILKSYSNQFTKVPLYIKTS